MAKQIVCTIQRNIQNAISLLDDLRDRKPVFKSNMLYKIFTKAVSDKSIDPR